MKSFDYQRVQDLRAAVHILAASPGAQLLGGGTNLIDLMKCGVVQPQHLVDISRLRMDQIESLPHGGVRIGAMARNSDTANHPLIYQQYPLLAQAILSGASPQIRNMATAAGNLMQRTRCAYFMDTGFPACNKRAPGTGCAALEGINRDHAIFGASESCIATHPSDMCVALLALDAVIEVTGPKGDRSIAIERFHRLPEDSPQTDTNLQPDEVIVSIKLPASRFANHAHYLKVRDRNSFAFALVSVAVGLELNGKTIQAARIALGGVAHKPWRVLDAEQSLI